MFQKMLRVHLTVLIIAVACKETKCKAFSDDWKCSKTSCFKFVTKESGLNWTEARSSCIDLDADLASIINEEEQNIIKTKLFRYKSKWKRGFWIGLNDRKKEGDFEWADGTPYQSNRWHDKQYKSRRKTNENCVEVYLTGSTVKWNDNNCVTKRPAVCKIAKMPAQITNLLPTLTRTQYQNAQISCTARGIPKPTITWKRKGSRQFFRGRIQTPGRNTRNDQVINTLTISNRVQTRHAGVYICTATNTVNKKTRTVARETRLVVQVPAQITNLLPTLTRTQYQNAQISCTAQGIPKPTIFWMRKGSLQLFRERTQPPGRNTRNDQVVSTLTISNRVLTSDAGVYICTATNRVNKLARTTSRETRLIVQVPAQITNLLPTLTRTQYQNAQISCTARGVPKPTITWKRKGSRHFLRGRTQPPGRNTRNDQVVSTLTISSRVQTIDAGVYICTATNTVNKRARTASSQTRLVVHGNGTYFINHEYISSTNKTTDNFQ